MNRHIFHMAFNLLLQEDSLSVSLLHFKSVSFCKGNHFVISSHSENPMLPSSISACPIVLFNKHFLSSTTISRPSVSSLSEFTSEKRYVKNIWFRISRWVIRICIYLRYKLRSHFFSIWYSGRRNPIEVSPKHRQWNTDITQLINTSRPVRWRHFFLKCICFY